jgi:uncharacterized protein YbjT (DUF2867 family)
MERLGKKVLVCGATGQQGGAVACHLLDQGFRVLALTRDISKPAAQELKKRGCELLRGDLDNTESYSGVLDGVYGVFSVQNPLTAGIDGEIRQGISLADAALEHGVTHFVYSSVGGANLNTGIPFFDSKWTIEQHIRQIGLAHTIVRPVFFMENWHNYLRSQILSGTIPLPLDPDKILQMIAIDDIGGIVAEAFVNPDQWRGEFELAGDEMSMREVAGLFSRILGRKVKYVKAPWDEFRQQAGEDMTKMYRWFNDHGYRANISSLRRKYPRLATLETVLRAEDWRMRMTA